MPLLTNCKSITCSLFPAKGCTPFNNSSTITPTLHQSLAALTTPVNASGAL